MPADQVTFVNLVVVPAGLMAIMFSLGLSLAGADFRRLAEHPRAVGVGLAGQFLMLPVLGWAIAFIFRLPPEMATGLFILAVCPSGVSSNAIVFAARANVALAVTLTALTSILTVVTIPIMISLALNYYFAEGTAPTLPILDTILQLVKMTALPVSLGMLIRLWKPALAERLVVWLRPVSVIILVCVILFSVIISADLVMANLVTAGPAAWALNVCAMAAGLGIARLARLDRKDSLTIAIEVGVHNATMATFLTLSVLNSWELAITPTIYGVLMIVNAGLLVRYLNWRGRRAASAAD